MYTLARAAQHIRRQGRFRWVESIFRLKENRTTVRRELLAGLTTFMTMAYVVIVNPQILSESGMPVGGVFATCISSAVAMLVLGLWANYPIALAPGMSLNAYFTCSIVPGRGVPWKTALGVVFLSGVLLQRGDAHRCLRRGRIPARRETSTRQPRSSG